MAKKSQIPPPEGFRYQADILSVEKEQSLVEHISKLPLKEFEFHGYVGKRRTCCEGNHALSGKTHPRRGRASLFDHF